MNGKKMSGNIENTWEIKGINGEMQRRENEEWQKWNNHQWQENQSHDQIISQVARDVPQMFLD